MTKEKLEIPGRTFKEFFRAIAFVSDECRLYINDGHLHTKVVDAANVMLIEIDADVGKGLDAQASTIKDIKTTPVILGMPVSHVKQLSKLIADTDLVVITWEPKYDKNVYQVTLKTKNYLATLLTTNPEYMRKEPKPPVIPSTATFSMDFSRIAEFAELANTACRFTVKDGCLTCKTTFDKGSKAEITTKPATGAATCLYSSDYLVDIAKSFPSQRMVAEFATDKPLTVSLNHGQMQVRWMLAPRINTDGNEDD